MLDRLAWVQAKRSKNWNRQSYDDSDFGADDDDNWWGEPRYSRLDGDYEKTVDDPRDAGVVGEGQEEGGLREETQRQAEATLRQALRPASPLVAATAESPRGADGPLFAEFRRGVILSLGRPTALDERAFESALSSLVRSRLMLAGSGASLGWTSRNAGARQWRELELPMLGWGVCYARRGRELIVSNNASLLAEMLAGEGQLPRDEASSVSSIDDLTIIRFAHRRQAFDSVVGKLDAVRIEADMKARGVSDESNADAASQAFFSGNISSLLDVASSVSQVTIKRSSRAGRLREEVEISLKP
ncbi:MAG: hypothetical protein LC754_09320 [Acidobacteria bacterium]|nr:hypothetical protein [Acidobacteriota bacterium]